MASHHPPQRLPALAAAAAAASITLPCRYRRHSNDEVIRCAIAVHNIGCALLETDRYEAAHETLTDAARAMATLYGDARVVEQNEGSGDRDEGRSRRLSVELASMLAAANQRLACPGRQATLTPSPRFNLLPSLRIEVEQMDDVDNDAAPCLAVMTAISLHNFGVSCFYRSIGAGYSDEVQMYLQIKAILLLQASYSLMKDCGPFTAFTVGYALHILENLDLSSRLHSASWWPSTRVNVTTASTAAVQDELSWLRATVHAFEAADVNVLGRPILAPAA